MSDGAKTPVPATSNARKEIDSLKRALATARADALAEAWRAVDVVLGSPEISREFEGGEIKDRIASLRDAARVESLTDKDVLEDAAARGVDPKKEGAAVRGLLLDAALRAKVGPAPGTGADETRCKNQEPLTEASFEAIKAISDAAHSRLDVCEVDYPAATILSDAISALIDERIAELEAKLTEYAERLRERDELGAEAFEEKHKRIVELEAMLAASERALATATERARLADGRVIASERLRADAERAVATARAEALADALMHVREPGPVRESIRWLLDEARAKAAASPEPEAVEPRFGSAQADAFFAAKFAEAGFTVQPNHLARLYELAKAWADAPNDDVHKESRQWQLAAEVDRLRAAEKSE